MKELTLTKGQKTIVCDCHYDKVKDYKWSSVMFGNKKPRWYAMRGTHTTRNGKHYRESFLMHRVISGAIRGQIVDHKDGDSLNNQCSNLRIASQAQNNANQKGAKKGSKSGIKGVYWHKGANKWCAEVVHNKKKHYLGLFETLEEARIARNKKAKELHGDFYYPA